MAYCVLRSVLKRYGGQHVFPVKRAPIGLNKQRALALCPLKASVCRKQNIAPGGKCPADFGRFRGGQELAVRKTCLSSLPGQVFDLCQQQISALSIHTNPPSFNAYILSSLV